jgi:hydroxypyruvate reductase
MTMSNPSLDANRSLRESAEAIWRAGVSAVDSTKLVKQILHCSAQTLTVFDHQFRLDELDRIIVVGAGKAGAGMAAGVEAALGDNLVDAKVTGWINVPADCVRPLRQIHLHPARPAGINEPTAEGVQGSERILDLVESMTDRDLCLVLISGGGSALLPAPSEGISLADKLLVTRHLMHSGATIEELNTVRKRISRIKGGGLLRAAPAGKMISLIISDVSGDPLDIIASGPTVCDSGTAREALNVLDRLIGRDHPEKAIPKSVWKLLERKVRHGDEYLTPRITCRNIIIGNNLTAVRAAAQQATSLGFEVTNLGSDRQGIAREVGVELAELCLTMRDQEQPRSLCFLAGGEPVVKLAASKLPRRGGRNQEVALAAAARMEDENLERIIVLSGGTDGEDGPTDAAGAFIDADVQQRMKSLNLHPQAFLDINDSYTFFSQVDGLLKTGPTHTNVMDLQVAIVTGKST